MFLRLLNFRRPNSSRLPHLRNPPSWVPMVWSSCWGFTTPEHLQTTNYREADHWFRAPFHTADGCETQFAPRNEPWDATVLVYRETQSSKVSPRCGFWISQATAGGLRACAGLRQHDGLPAAPGGPPGEALALGSMASSASPGGFVEEPQQGTSRFPEKAKGFLKNPKVP